VITILEHKNYEWRSGLAVNGLYHRDKASVQRAWRHSAKCADTAGHPGDHLYNGELQPQQWTDTRPLRLQVNIYCGLYRSPWGL
jgi:hypothetical protein